VKLEAGVALHIFLAEELDGIHLEWLKGSNLTNHPDGLMPQKGILCPFSTNPSQK
jgi:hypothetical protein